MTTSRVCFNEAPAFLPGNSWAFFDIAATKALASMRPRHFYRGIGRRFASAARPRRPCFNEAPAFLPGNRRSGRLFGFARRAGFNEAPAFLPGNRTRGGAAGSPASSCFNEAPAFLPGIRSATARPVIGSAALQ